MRLDNYEKFPKAVTDYLNTYGWHFSKKMCQFAISKMTNRKGEKLTPTTKDELEQILKKYAITIQHNDPYDMLYVFNMARADFNNSAIVDEEHLVKFVKDYLDDIDGYEGIALTRFVADCIGKGCVIYWEDMI